MIEVRCIDVCSWLWNFLWTCKKLFWYELYFFSVLDNKFLSMRGLKIELQPAGQVSFLKANCNFSGYRGKHLQGLIVSTPGIVGVWLFNYRGARLCPFHPRAARCVDRALLAQPCRSPQSQAVGPVQLVAGTESPTAAGCPGSKWHIRGHVCPVSGCLLSSPTCEMPVSVWGV